METGESRPSRPAWSEFKRELDAAGFRPSKARGQNFLLDTNMARSIARDAGVGPGDLVLEVGPGCGFLTVHLAELGVRLVAVEIDGRLFEVASRFLADRPDVRMLHADVLATKNRLATEVLHELPESGPWHLVSNLPYSVSGPVVAVLSRLPNPPVSMTVLVQREVAERIAAEPGTKAWGALPARLAPLYRRTLGRRVGAGLFWPRPRVESAVVQLEALEREPGGSHAGGALASYDRLVEGLFRTRRKTVRVGLKGLLGDSEAAEAMLAEVGVAPDARPEVLTVGELWALAGSPVWVGAG